MSRFQSLGLRAVRSFDPERAHRMAIHGLRAGLVPPWKSALPGVLRTQVLGFDLAHPLGLAAGFDKNAEAVGPLLNCGFSFVEIGAVTPRPQYGNPKPRLFRLSEDAAAINRFGFNNEGVEAVRKRLFLKAHPARGPIGVNPDWGQSRRQQRQRGSCRRLRHCAHTSFRLCRLFHDQCFFAEHAGTS